ncbi:hypothetical protein PMO31116_00502 [Pandoraea morbifera]|uniref:Lipoprotein n=1 Tax=Pandoraea morbifera TaxID=2508300 RepID=A0A5E4RZZ1_9BURK|nr:hypothetical protein [Pandoraea morbifera]VVD69040.1 hypothetical protein PMO31116_00502 [Pandoraea morbifera]
MKTKTMLLSAVIALAVQSQAHAGCTVIGDRTADGIARHLSAACTHFTEPYMDAQRAHEKSNSAFIDDIVIVSLGSFTSPADAYHAQWLRGIITAQRVIWAIPESNAQLVDYAKQRRSSDVDRLYVIPTRFMNSNGNALSEANYRFVAQQIEGLAR